MRKHSNTAYMPSDMVEVEVTECSHLHKVQLEHRRHTLLHVSCITVRYEHEHEAAPARYLVHGCQRAPAGGRQRVEAHRDTGRHG